MQAMKEEMEEKAIMNERHLYKPYDSMLHPADQDLPKEMGISREMTLKYQKGRGRCARKINAVFNATDGSAEAFLAIMELVSFYEDQIDEIDFMYRSLQITMKQQREEHEALLTRRTSQTQIELSMIQEQINMLQQKINQLK